VNILVPGGCGYIGSYLVPFLLADGHEVIVVDPQWFGNTGVPDNPRAKLYRSAVEVEWSKIDAVIFLASLSSNTACENNPELEDQTNRVLPLEYLKKAKAHGVERFIFASSVAAYGTSDKYMTEDMDLRPSTVYGTGKEYAEALMIAYSTDIATVRVRSASVCGASPNVRFDVTLNKMVHDAVNLGVINVNGGNQYRCHVSIKDLCDFYRLLLNAPVEKIAGHAFNVVKENQTVMESAKLVSEITRAKIETLPSSDNRSYKVDASKARDVLGFTAKHNLLVTLNDLKIRVEAGYWPYSMKDPSYQRLTSARW